MNKKTILIGLLIFTLFSCSKFQLKKEHKDEIVKEELNKLNWNEVDQPPLFEVCKHKSEEELDQCFQQTITEHIHDYLAQQEFAITQSINDTIWIPLLITKDSQIIVEDFDLPDIVASEIPNLTDIIEKGIQTLPKAEPAHTRGTPVSAKYKLPIVIHID